MNIALFGGSFDPFHRGHKRIVKALNKLDYIDKVYLMPAGQQPFKQDKFQSFASYRLAMAELACQKLDKVKVSRFEIEKKGMSYTSETLEKLSKKADKLYLAIGGDSLKTLETWHDAKTIFKLAHILVASRPGVSGLKKEKKYLEKKYGAKITFLKIKEKDVSSTEIRRIYKYEDPDSKENKKFLKKSLNKPVRKFIKQNGIYKNKNLGKIFSGAKIDYLQDLERIIIQNLSTYRAVHSINTMYQAIYIAQRMDYDLWTAALAGLLHDSAKELKAEDYPEFMQYMQEKYPSLLQAPALIHGPLAVYLMQKKLNIDDEEIHHAIFFHTILDRQVSPLDKIVYLADKTEASRGYPGVDDIRKLLDKDVNEALLLAIDLATKRLEEKGGSIHPNTRAAIKQIKADMKRSK